MEKEFNTYSPYMNYGSPQPQADDLGNMYSDPTFNPILQYEQAYTYYRFLCMQMDYKIKCKEYEKMCGNSKTGNSNINSTSNNVRPR